MSSSPGSPDRQQHRGRRLGSIVLFLTALLLATTTVADAASAPEGSSLGLTAAYTLRVDLSFDGPRLDVVESIDITNTTGAAVAALRLSVLARAYGEMDVRSVTVDGHRTRFDFPDVASMRVRLPRPLEGGRSTRVVIRFTDRPGPDVADSLHARLSKADGVLRVADWFPLLSDGHGLRNPGDSQVSPAASSITLDLQTDPGLVVAAPGHRTVTRDGRQIYRLDHARDYAFALARHLRRWSAVTRDGVRVRVFAPVGTDGRRALRLAVGALQTYDDAYGPYPWPELVVAPTPGGWIATESPGLVFLGTDTYANPEVVRHEVAHQWFYALVGDDQLREPWVDEAFATFSEHALFGRRAWGYCSRRPVDSPVTAFPDRFDRWGCGGYVETVYEKGAAMIQGVRRFLGDRAFFATMRGFIAQHRFALVTGEDVVRAWLDAGAARPGLMALLERFLPRTLRSATAGAGRSIGTGRS